MSLTTGVPKIVTGIFVAAEKTPLARSSWGTTGTGNDLAADGNWDW